MNGLIFFLFLLCANFISIDSKHLQFNCTIAQSLTQKTMEKHIQSIVIYELKLVEPYILDISMA